MGNKERLKGILERQAAAAEQERLDEEEASAKTESLDFLDANTPK